MDTSLQHLVSDFTAFLATNMHAFQQWLSQVAVTPSNSPAQVYSQFLAICAAASMLWANFFFYISIDLYSSIATFSVTPLLLLWPLLQSYICGTDWSSSGNININAKGTLLQFLVFTWCLPKFSAVGRRRSVLWWSVHCFCWWHWWSSSWLSFTAHFLELLHLTLCQLLQC